MVRNLRWSRQSRDGVDPCCAPTREPSCRSKQTKLNSPIARYYQSCASAAVPFSDLTCYKDHTQNSNQVGSEHSSSLRCCTRQRMDSIIRVPGSPGSPLHPISPERLNRSITAKSPSQLTESITISSDSTSTPTPRARESDVQFKVAQFNNLSKDALQRRHDIDAARRRAEMAREQAENESKALRIQLDESKTRLNKLNQKLENVLVRWLKTFCVYHY